MSLATESSGYVCLRNPCDPSWFAACPCEVGIELDNMLVPFYWGSLYIICTFVHSLILKYPLFRHNFLIYTNIRTYRRTNKRPEYIYWVYSRRSTTFVFRCSPNSWFLTIFDIFSRDRQTDRQTDRPTRVGIEAPSPELKKFPNFKKNSKLLDNLNLICALPRWLTGVA